MFGIETKAVNDKLHCCFEFSHTPMRHSIALISVELLRSTPVCYVMFKTRAAVFYRDLKPRGAAEWFQLDPIKHVLRVF